jgi:hypothetical protein
MWGFQVARIVSPLAHRRPGKVSMRYHIENITRAN